MKKQFYIFFIGFISSLTSYSQWSNVSDASIISTNLNTVSIASNDTIYAAGLFGEVVKSVDKGETWTSLTSGTGSNLNDIYFLDHNTGMFVGQSGILRRTTDGGANWTTIASGTASELYSIHFPSSNVGYIAGQNGYVGKSTNGGVTWSSITSPTGTKIQDINFLNDSLGYIVGDANIIFKTTDGGATWTTQTSPHLPNTNNYFKVQATSTDSAFSCGGDKRIMKTINGGSTWQTVTNNTGNFYRSLAFVNNNTGYIVGANGVVLFTNNGNSFASQTTPITDILFDIDITPCGFAIAVGASGAIIKKDDEAVSTSADAYKTKQDSTITITVANGVLNNDNPNSIFTPKAMLNKNVSNGTLSLNADGSLEYTPNANFFGADTFTYNLVAGCNTSDETEVTITVDKKPIDTTSLSKYILHEVDIYPNPATQHVLIKSEITIDNITIFNSLGKKVLNKNINTTIQNLELNNFNTGFYTLLVTFTDQSVSINKLVIKK